MDSFDNLPEDGLGYWKHLCGVGRDSIALVDKGSIDWSWSDLGSVELDLFLLLTTASASSR